MGTTSTTRLGKRRSSATCIIVTYNQEFAIRAAIQSALDQTVPFNQIIVVDDGSTDDTPNITKSFAKTSRVQVVESPRVGPQGALNLGLEAVSSDVVFLLGGDDICLPHRVERQIETLALTEVDGAFSLPVLIDEHGRQLRDAVRPGLFELPSEDSLLLQLLVRGNFLCAPTAALRVASLPQPPVFNPDLWFAQDYDLWLRMLLAGSSFCVDENRVTAYRVHHASLSGSPSLRRKVADEAERVRVSALAATLEQAASSTVDPAASDVATVTKFVLSALKAHGI
jgi:glycosyltransferase involved in cell wall biosynthesis